MASRLLPLVPRSLRRPAFPDLSFAAGTPLGASDQSARLGARGSIAFLVPGMVAGSGGHTSILRLGTWLARFGHDVTYLSYDDRSRGALETRAARNLAGWRGRMLPWREFTAQRPAFDVGVATHWDSCYRLLRHQAGFGRKAYFIQDYEPYFYPRGDWQLLAEQTYAMGLQHLSLGGWNLERIQAHLGLGGGAALDFPVELEQYPLVRRALAHGRTLKLAAYVKEDARRAPALISHMLEAARRGFQARGIATETRVFGMRDAGARLPTGRNLGKLATPAIQALYAWADFGVVSSLTNMSLVNYEMLACGLPVVDLLGGSAPTFFGAGELLLARPRPEGLDELLQAWWGRAGELQSMVARAQDRIVGQRLTWERTARQFEAALQAPFPGTPGGA